MDRTCCSIPAAVGTTTFIVIGARREAPRWKTAAATCVTIVLSASRDLRPLDHNQR